MATSAENEHGHVLAGRLRRTSGPELASCGR